MRRRSQMTKLTLHISNDSYTYKIDTLHLFFTKANDRDSDKFFPERTLWKYSSRIY